MVLFSSNPVFCTQKVVGEAVLFIVIPSLSQFQPFERWTAGPHVPLRVFEAFNLPQDFSSYVDRTRTDVADRCLTRAGRFIADMKHIVQEYRADEDGQWRSESLREMAVIKEQRAAAEKRASDAEARVKELSTELDKLKMDHGEAIRSIGKLTEELEGGKKLLEAKQKERDDVSLDLDHCRARPAGEVEPEEVPK
ncbi:hypothetical protein POM88_044872 [Heracleum sosnowskyi]|uniref:Uncharacterized protein n=1 Tax=Heracleum sosnowskyi TaxID=360622 RepID=A0AAD8H5C5_9APIA|nr:hypothetical protein POM88_044872 [Heracleum sosnowskyi]